MNLHYGLIHVGLPTMVDLAKDKLPNIKKENMPKNFELCKEGDVAFADASEDTNEVAKTIEFYNLARENIVCGLHTIHGRDNKNKTVVGFKGYAFSSAAFHNQIRIFLNVILDCHQNLNRLKSRPCFALLTNVSPPKTKSLRT